MKLPATRFYWAVIEAPGIRAGPLPPGLWPLFEEDLPVSADGLWAVGVPIDDHSFLACALTRSELAESTGVLEVTPEDAPAWVDTPVDVTRLNLLIGDYEPAVIRARRNRHRLIHAALTLMAAALCIAGVERRAKIWREESRSLKTMVRDTLSSVSPDWTADDLAMALSDQKLAAPASPRLPEDAAVVLAGVLEGWPTKVPARVQSMSASSQNASVSVLISGDAAAFIAAIHPPGGWKLEEPRLVNINEATRVNVELRKVHP